MSAQLHRSRPPTYNNSEQKDEEWTRGRVAVLFCWCRAFQSSPSAPEGYQYTFCFSKHQLFIARSMKQTSPSCALPFSVILRWFSESVLCQGQAKVLWFASNLPPVTHLMVWPMPTDDDWWCQSKRAQSGFGGVRSGGGGVGWGWGLDGEARG